MVERRLAAIFSADVVGYSRMIRADEDGTLLALRTLREELIDPRIAQHRGRIVKLMGDGLLIEFASVVDAVACAADMQLELAKRNSDEPDNLQIVFRMGINLGDVVIDGADIHGDGVNLAARMESLAEPGGLTITDAVYEQVRDRLDISFADAGFREVKNIDRPVRTWNWHPSGSSAGPGFGGGAAGKPLPDKPSIAVLRFINMSGDPEQDYFADGMVEDVITGLARMTWLYVIARNTSLAFEDPAVDAKQVGRELGVRYVLEGSVRTSSNRVRVTAQLIEIETGRHIWAERYDRTMDDVFALQDELTLAVTAAIEPNLRQAEIDRVTRTRPDSLAAYELTLRALPHVYAAMADGAREALPLLERAVEMEPGYAQAHGFAAWCHEILFSRCGGSEENRRGARVHAEAAIAHGKDDAIALTLGGFVTGIILHDRPAALRAFEAAQALSPSCALAYNFGSCVLALDGEAERAIEWSEIALRLSPRDPLNYALFLANTLALFQMGDYKAAATMAQRTKHENPYWVASHFLVAATQSKLGNVEEARLAVQRVLELQPGFTIEGVVTAFNMHHSITTPLTEALLAAGLPE